MLCAALLGFASSLLSAAPLAPQVTVTQPWVRATVAQQTSTGAFLTLNAASDARLVEVKSGVAAMVEIHEMAMDGDTMKMRSVAAVALPAGQKVELKPGAYHVMLMGLKRQLVAGEKVPLTLVFESPSGKARHSVEVRAEVRALGGR